MRHDERLVVLAAALLLLGGASVQAHDVWLATDAGVLPVGGTLLVRQFVGIELEPEEEVPLIRRTTSRFQLITDRSTEDLLKALPPEKDLPVVQPVLTRTLTDGGLALVAMDHDLIYGEFTEEAFAEYLAHEEFRPGEIPWTRGQRSAERERYVRSLKCLASIGEGAGDVFSRVVGQRLEILLKENPYQSAIGDPLHAQILFEGQPLKDKLVVAFQRHGTGPVTKYRARTDDQGIATFALAAPGHWLIRLVHMRPCVAVAESDCEDYDWETDWSSFTFLRPDATGHR
jgi:uncharacterized GH25 family protein